MFKSVLDNEENLIKFPESFNISESQIDCSDCRNYWLIRDNKNNQIRGGYCQGENNLKRLFSKEIVDKLDKKCK